MALGGSLQRILGILETVKILIAQSKNVISDRKVRLEPDR